MVMLQFENVFFAVIIIQLDAGLLGGEPRLRRLFLAHEGRTGRRLGNSYAG